MATWTSPKFEFRDWHSDYDPGEFSHVEWSYQTTADCLTLARFDPVTRCAYGHGEFPARREEQMLGPHEAKATYMAMRNWVRVYLGERELERLDAEEMEKGPKP